MNSLKDLSQHHYHVCVTLEELSSTGFDGRGNYNMGIKEQIIFPEIDIDKVNKITGMDITFVTSTNSDEEAKSLLTEFGLPFKKVRYGQRINESQRSETSKIS